MQLNHAAVSQHIPNAGNAVKHSKQADISNHFDDRLNDLMEIAKDLLINKGVFHLAVHFSSSQLVCWTLDNPYSFRVYASEEVFAGDFLSLFSPLKTKAHSCIDKGTILPILKSFESLRNNSGGSELRNASIHMLNGYLGLTFACDDTRYINYKDFALPSVLDFSA